MWINPATNAQFAQFIGEGGSLMMGWLVLYVLNERVFMIVRAREGTVAVLPARETWEDTISTNPL